jgi:hypothetical protein
MVASLALAHRWLITGSSLARHWAGCRSLCSLGRLAWCPAVCRSAAAVQPTPVQSSPSVSFLAVTCTRPTLSLSLSCSLFHPHSRPHSPSHSLHPLGFSPRARLTSSISPDLSSPSLVRASAGCRLARLLHIAVPTNAARLLPACPPPVHTLALLLPHRYTTLCPASQRTPADTPPAPCFPSS